MMLKRATKLFKATQQEYCLPRTRIAEALQYARSETMKALCQSSCVGQDGQTDLGNHLSPGVFHGYIGTNTITSYRIVSKEASGGGWTLSGGSNKEEIEEGVAARNGVAYWLQTDREGKASVVYGKFSLDNARPGQLIFRGTYVSVPLDTNHGKVKLTMVFETDDLDEMYESSASSLVLSDLEISQRFPAPSNDSGGVNDSFDKSWSPPDMLVVDPSCYVGDGEPPLQIEMDDGTTVPQVTPPTRRKKKSKKNGVSSSPRSPKSKKEKIESTLSSNNVETETKKKKKITKKKVNSDDLASRPRATQL